MFLSSLVPQGDKVIIVGDFNIHADIENESFGSTFILLIDSICFCQCVHKSTHCLNHTLALVLTYWIEIDHRTVFPHNPF